MKGFCVLVLLVAVAVLVLVDAGSSKKNKEKSKDKYNKDKSGDKYNKGEKYNKGDESGEKYKQEKSAGKNKDGKSKEKYVKEKRAKEQEVIQEEEEVEVEVEEVEVEVEINNDEPTNAEEQVQEEEQVQNNYEELRRQNEELRLQNEELKNKKNQNVEVVAQLSHGGEVRGLTMMSSKRRTFYSFRGIHYAEAPIGELRFKPPVAKAPWVAGMPLDATMDGVACPQGNFMGTFPQDEDCLLLNVYTPQLPEPEEEGEEEEEEEDEDESMPVLVWFHGGGFVLGSSDSRMYGPEYFLDHRVVLVTVNYRLGALGFLSTEDAAAPGNYGLLDQVLALEWVRDNIAQFAGDPSRVTIFGESAGAAIVGFHLLSPLSSRLFHNVAILSGSPSCLWTHHSHHAEWTTKLATAVGCDTNGTSEQIVACLRGIPTQDLLSKNDALYPHFLFPLVQVPRVDNHFLLDDPRTIFASGRIANRVPVIAGVTSKEGVFIHEMMQGMFPDKMTVLDKSFVTGLIGDLIDANPRPGSAIEATNSVYEKYFASVDANDPIQLKRAWIELFSDGMFDMCNNDMIQLLAQAGVPVYSYVYNHTSARKFTLGKGGNPGDTIDWGVGHAAELTILFSMKLPGLPAADANDQMVTSNFTTLLVNFAARGNPTPQTRRKKFTVEWIPSASSPITSLYIENPLRLSTEDPSADPLFAFWTKQVPDLLAKEKMLQQNAQRETVEIPSKIKEEL